MAASMLLKQKNALTDLKMKKKLWEEILFLGKGI